MMSFAFTTITIIISFSSGLVIGLFYKKENEKKDNKRKESKKNGLPKPK